MRRFVKMLRFRLLSASSAQRYTDVAAALTLFALTLLADGDLFRNEITLGSDAATQYYPFYYFLGESLRSGAIPAWNPYQFSGTPFAADPLTGWGYLPAMVLFTLLPLVAAAKGFMLLHLLLAGLCTYALARVLGIGTPGALLAAIAYEFSGLMYLDNACCFQFVGIVAWLPLAFLGVELAICSPRWLGRGLWWGVSGLALSQMFAAWFGQGSYYALLALGGYIAYRTLLSPPENLRKVRSRLLGCVLHGAAVLAFGLALAALGVLPRLEYNALSNLAGGYPTGLGTQTGWSVGDWVLLLKPGVWYAGITVLALTLVAPLVVRKRFAVPYFAFLSLCALVLTGPGPTPLHSVLYLMPYFDRLHPYGPERVVVVFYLGAALLAGATITTLKEKARGKPSLLALPALAALLLGLASTLFPPIPEGKESLYPLLGAWEDLYPLVVENGIPIPLASLLFLLSAILLVAAYALVPARLLAGDKFVFALLILVVFADLMVANRATMDRQDLTGEGWVLGIHDTDLAEYYQPSGAAHFLRLTGEEGAFRYLCYDPGLGDTSHLSSPRRFDDPNVQALEASSRSVLLGLQNIQGYNPTHIARYDEYMRALNQTTQNYHFIDVYERGLGSPLLNLLNARYIIVPSYPSQENPESVKRFGSFEEKHPVVYEDDQTKVLENRNALPRAWIVHSAQQVGSEKESLRLLDSEEVNPKETALLEGELPQQISQPADPSADQASVAEYEANRIRIKTSTETPGLLMLSEVYYPAWKAYVDDQPVPVEVADGLLRSVAIPAGQHTVELRYESRALQVGIVISVVAYLALAALAIASAVRLRRKRKIAGDSSGE